MDTSTFMFSPRDWNEFNKKAIVNLHRNNEKRNWLYGPLGSLPVEQVEFLQEVGFVVIFKNFSYVWSSGSSVSKWLQFKKTIQSKFCKFTVEKWNDSKGKEFEIKKYTNEFMMSNSDYIATAINRKETIMRRYPTTVKDIESIELSSDEIKIIDDYKQFDNKLIFFYEQNNIPKSVYTIL